MSNFRIIGRNILSNWTGMAVHIGVMFVLTPFVLAKLGAAAYGVWLLTAGLTGYYGLLDFGFRPALTIFLTRYLATQDFDKMNRTASSGLAALVASGGLLTAISVAAAWLAARSPWLFQVSEELRVDFAWCIAIAGISAAMQFPFFLCSAVFTATQRYDAANAVGIATRLVTAGGTFLCLALGYGLIGLSLVTAAANLLGYLAQAVVAARILPQLRPAIGLVNGASCREIAVFGAWNSLITISGQLLWYTDLLVVGAVLPMEAVTRYGLAQNISRSFMDVMARMSQVFFPAAARLHAQQDGAGLTRMYLVGSRGMLLVSVVLAMIGGVWAEDFFALWIPREHLTGDQYPSVATVFHVLLVASVCVCFPGVGGQILLGANRVRTLAQLAFAEAVANLALSVVLVRTMGLLGVAVGTLAPALVFRVLLLPLAVSPLVRVSLGGYLNHACLRPAAVGLLLLGPIVTLRAVWPASGWGALVTQGLLALAAAGAFTVLVGLTGDERRRWVMRPAVRLVRIIAWRDAPPVPDRSGDRPASG